MGASKKGISAHQLHRMLGITYKSAWFMGHAHPVANAMDPLHNGLVPPDMGGEGKVVERDRKLRSAYSLRAASGLSGVQIPRRSCRWSNAAGKVRSPFVEEKNKRTLKMIVNANVRKGTSLYTDDAPMYRNNGMETGDHASVNHTEKEYARGDIHTQTVEGFFSVFKRGGMVGFHISALWRTALAPLSR